MGFFGRADLLGTSISGYFLSKPLLSPCCSDTTVSALYMQHGASNSLESMTTESANNNTNFVGLYTECCNITQEVQSSGRWPQLGRDHYK
jgi:hypothetical protein